MGRYAIVPGDPDRCEIIAAHLENPRKVAQKREYTTWQGEMDGELITVTSTGIGGPSAASSARTRTKGGRQDEAGSVGSGKDLAALCGGL